MYGYFQSNPFIPQGSQKSINYVNGKAGVESDRLFPGSSDVYIDTAAKKFYTKAVDTSGATTIKRYSYTEDEEDKPIEYVTKQEFDTFVASLKGVEHESNADSNAEQ